MTFNEGATEYVVTCDHPGCNAEAVHHTYTQRQARLAFEEKGWRIGRKSTMSPYRCYCPEHKTDVEQ